jgi:hypothetical protein
VRPGAQEHVGAVGVEPRTAGRTQGTRARDPRSRPGRGAVDPTEHPMADCAELVTRDSLIGVSEPGHPLVVESA